MTAKRGERKSIRFEAALICDQGTVRCNNEDNFLFDGGINSALQDHCSAAFAPKADGPLWQIMGVFDGMGGGEMGELAARIAAETVKEHSEALNEGSNKADADSLIREAFLKSNNKVVDLQKEHHVYGTTGTVAAIGGGELKIYHLGDSRAYLMREGVLMQLTRDQTLAQMKIDAGLCRENDPGLEAERHKLTEYIGRDWTKENLRPQESQWISIRKNDRLLLCTDGLYDMCSAEKIAAVLEAGGSPENAAEALTEAALESGGRDNVTCMVIFFSDPVCDDY